MLLPTASSDQAYCNVSALEAGIIGLPLNEYIEAPADVVLFAPSLSFLVQHARRSDKLVFDLGIRKDWHNLPPNAIALDDENNMALDVRQDVVESLAKGGLATTDIATVCLSHCHFDHVGDPQLFPTSAFLVGAAAASLFNPGYPANPSSNYPSNLLPADRTRYLSPDDWAPVGPFPRALDFYGDGSLYIVDAAGHHHGHLNVLARTSADGRWLLMAGDSAHHWSLVTGENEIATAHGCAHMDKEAAEEHLARIREFMKEPRVRVLLAHDEPWYKENKDGPSFWPGKIVSL
ncbi:Metallo-hydrolase/oxidoreductase [Lyophyllum atratum]|nr:Metallo-hydrolase/oxidoreductase [Lyophyllum atratum]